MPRTTYNQDYVRDQIRKMMNYPLDDCLFRIGSHVGLLQPGEEIDDSNRQDVLTWVESFRLGDRATAQRR